MSGNNPYAVNGYGSSNAPSNPYGSNPYGGNNPYASEPYSNQNNATASSASVNSYGSGPRNDRSRPPGNGLPSSAANPYGRAPPPRRERPQERDRSPAPQNLNNPYEGAPHRPRSPVPANPYAQADPAPSRAGGGGYGGLGPPQPDPEFDRRGALSPRPRTSGAGQDGGYGNTGDRVQSQGDSRSRERRARSDAADRDMMPPPQARPDRPPMPKQQSSARQPANDTAYGGNRSYSSGRPTKSMDEILRHIQNSWNMMEGDECIPVKVALQLADPSSLGLGDREHDFADTHVDLQKSLKSVVNEHYADFNSAVGTYHKIQSSIKESQSRVRYLKNGLSSVKGGMLTTRPELRDLAEQSGQLDELLLTINQMEALRELPSKLEEKINEKRWIGAVDILGEALISSRKSGLDDIGAMSDLRSYFASQESSLIDMLVEELHDHLYLKSPYCSERWRGRKVGSAEANPRDSFGGNAWDRPVYHFLAALDTKKAMTEDASKNPESDTFYYIQMIVEALNQRGYLEELVSRIEQRLPVELYKVVERTNQEIDAKHPSHLRTSGSKKSRKSIILQAGETDSKVLSDFLWTLYAKFEAIAEGHRVLHEVVLGIVERENLAKPEQYGASFKELWKLYQMEIRQLLHDYLATDGDLGGANKQSIAAGDVFARQPRDKNRRMFKLSEMDEKSSDIKTEEEELDEILKSSVPGLVTKSKNKDGTTSLLGDRGTSDGTAAGHKLLIEPSVFNMTILLPPSLTFLQHLKDIVPQTSNIPMSTLTSFLDDFLINVFHPQLEEAVTDLCTENMVDFEAFMEDSRWSKHSPHPIFKGTVGFMSLVQAFSAMLSAIPQDQMFTQLVITQLFKYYDRCYGFYKNIVSRVSQANQAGGIHTTVMKAAAGYADEGDIRETTLSLWNNKNMDRAARSDLMRKEVQLLIAASKATPIQAYDIISDPKSVHQLALVYNSMQWLSASLQQLRHVETTTGKTHSRNTSLTGQHTARRWTLITNLKTGGQTSSLSPQSTQVYLPLTSETAVPFDETLTSFRGLATKALLTLHLDIRCGIIHQLGRALRPPNSGNDTPAANPTLTSPTSNTPQSATPQPTTRESTPPPLDSGLYPFVLAAPPTSASPLILDLNNDLIHFEASITSYLGRKERRFILAGLGRLVDRYLVVGADFVGVMNRHGAERMRVDGMVVQQVLRGLGVSGKRDEGREGEGDTAGVGLGIEQTAAQRDAEVDGDDALLSSSSRYYELFLQGPDSIMAYVRERKGMGEGGVGYSYDELRTLVELCFSSSVRGTDREESIKARKRMGEVLLGLGEVMWDS
ncbi:exocyst subunit [Knufia fluminis]|uniref:Exocyst complex component Sec8 n=1 Tax=Knufia fluminis TaxID=191047 RepID=A0AAN8EFU9_9EURO|nr:exocyst subunit [Knufia fluminis]